MNGQMRSTGQSGTAALHASSSPTASAAWRSRGRAAECGEGIAGALLVAPSDPDRWRVARDAIVRGPFGFPSIVVASETDPWLDIEKARALAAGWGSRLVNAGAAGHINVDAGYGPWPEGERLLERLRAAAEPRALAIAL
jgi:predicted alpha/beta hydrolase family esterase